MGTSWMTCLALRLAGAAALDAVVLFQSEFSFGLEPRDPSATGAPAAPGAGAKLLPTTDVMPGGIVDVAGMKEALHKLNETMLTLRNDTIVDMLNAQAVVVSDVYNDAIKRMISDISQALERSRGLGELDTRRVFGEVMASLNSSFLALNESVPAADSHLTGIVPDGIRPSTIYKPGPTVQMVMFLLNNTEDFIERVKQHDDNLTASDFCAEATHFSQGVNAIVRIVDYSLEKQCQSKSGNSQENPEYNPLVMIAPDVIRPLQVFMDNIVSGGKKIHGSVKDLQEAWEKTATALLQDQVPCKLTKERLNQISSASSRTPFGLLFGAIAVALWLF